MVDKVTSVRRSKLDEPMGRLSVTTWSGSAGPVLVFLGLTNRADE